MGFQSKEHLNALIDGNLMRVTGGDLMGWNGDSNGDPMRMPNDNQTWLAGKSKI